MFNESNWKVVINADEKEVVLEFKNDPAYDEETLEIQVFDGNSGPSISFLVDGQSTTMPVSIVELAIFKFKQLKYKNTIHETNDDYI